LISGSDGEIYRKGLDSGEAPEQISSFGELLGHRAKAIHPEYSPDGSKIVVEVSDYLGVHLYTLDSDGTDPLKLVGGYYPRWSSTGQFVLFIRAGDSNELKNGTVWMYSIFNESASQLTFR
jgi:Tol biopolymer transport system component